MENSKEIDSLLTRLEAISLILHPERPWNDAFRSEAHKQWDGKEEALKDRIKSLEFDVDVKKEELIKRMVSAYEKLAGKQPDEFLEEAIMINRSYTYQQLLLKVETLESRVEEKLRENDTQ